MQEPSSKNKKGLYRLRRADPHERLSARLRHFSFGAAVVFVVAAAGIVIHSLYNIQIKNGATFRQYAAQQQLLDSTIQATRGEIYDTSGITLASTSVVWTIWADPSYSTALYTTTTDQDTKAETRTIDEAAMKEVCTQITLRKCDIYECSWGGIYMVTCLDVTFNGNTIRDLGEEFMGTWNEGTPFMLHDTKNITINGEKMPNSYIGN